jgi:hypothetical protein
MEYEMNGTLRRPSQAYLAQRTPAAAVKRYTLTAISHPLCGRTAEQARAVSDLEPLNAWRS